MPVANTPIGPLPKTPALLVDVPWTPTELEEMPRTPVPLLAVPTTPIPASVVPHTPELMPPRAAGYAGEKLVDSPITPAPPPLPKVGAVGAMEPGTASTP